MRTLYTPIQRLAPLSSLILVAASTLILSACENGQVSALTIDDINGDILEQGPGDYPLFIKPEGQELTEVMSSDDGSGRTAPAQVINCYKERFVHPPNKRNRSIGYRFVVKDEWAGKVDWQSISVNLDQADFDFTTDIDGNAVRFTNPGKSRAVIDVEYCTVPHNPPSDDGSGSSGGGDTGSGGTDGGSSSGGGDDGSTGGSDSGTGSGDGSGDWDPTDDGGIFVEGCQTAVDCGVAS